MNTENIIEYIRRSSTLRWKKSFFWMHLIYMPMVSFGFMMIGKMVGGYCYVSGIGAVVAFVVNFIALIVFLRRSSPIKNKFIVNFTDSCNMFFIVAFFCTAIHYELNLPENNLIFLFVLSVFIPVGLAVVYSKLLKRPETVFRKKTKITYDSVSHYVAGSAVAGRFVVGLIVKEYGHLISERALHLAIIDFLMFVMFVMSTSALDLQRYYYYTKLEKMGLVTEDILKPEE